MNKEIISKRILLIDDHPVCGCGLSRVTETNDNFTLAYYANTDATLTEDINPDIIVLEISSGNNQGLALIKGLRSLYPKAPVLILSSQAESVFAGRCLKAGAKGYVMKNADETEILEALKTSSNGKLYTSPSLKAQLLNQIS